MDDETLPEPPAPAAPPGKARCRERYKLHGWATPPGNLVVVYLDACARHNVPVNGAVMGQLQRRVRLMQSGPWERVAPAPDWAGSEPAPSPQRPAPAASVAHSASELRDLVQAHVYPLTLGLGLRPGTAGGAPGAGAPASEAHAATVSAAAVAAAVGGPGGQGPLYAARAVATVCRLLDPRRPWEEQLAAAGLPADCRVLSEADFGRLVESAAAGASLGELRQAALEVLCRPLGHGMLEVEGLAGALFDHLDVSWQGSISASELRTAVAAFSPAAAADLYGLLADHPPLARPGPEQVSRSEFVEIISALASGLVPPGSAPGVVRDKAEVAVNAIFESKIREPFAYDFSRCYLGPRGLLPVLDALGSDPAFASLSLANCGLGCSSVERLAEWIKDHPCLTSLDLSNNLIADRGGLALVALLQANPRIVELGIGATHLLPPRPSRTHHNALGPSACEDAGPVLAALAANRAARRSSPAEIVRALRQHGPELRALCFSLLAREGPEGGGAGGRVPLASLREALGEVTGEWGFTPEALDEVLQHEQLLGTATAGRTADASGRLGVTYEELMNFLRTEDQVLRVARAFRRRLPEAKQLFFSLAPEQLPTTAGGVTVTGVAGPRTALSTVRQTITEAAGQPGSGWDVSEADLEAVLCAELLRPLSRAAATGCAPPPGSAAAAAAPGPVVGEDGLLVPEWAATLPPAAGGSAGGDMLISWPELINTLLFVFNR